MKYNYRTLFQEIKWCVEQCLRHPTESLKSYMWIHETPFGVLADLEEKPHEDNSYLVDSLVGIDEVTLDYYVKEDAIHEIVRKWCLRPTLDETHDYKGFQDAVNGPITEEILIGLCETARDFIGGTNKSGAPTINVRYAADEGSFHLAKFGDYFFFEDRMYVIDTHPRWKQVHDEFVASAFFGNQFKRKGYVHPVAFCGIQTPFKDDKGAPVFTGDTCVEEDDPNKTYRVVTASRYKGYGFVGDNHMKLLSMCRKPVHRVGTIFYGLSIDAPLKNTWEHSSDIFSMWGQAEDIEEKLKWAKLTPNFTPDPLSHLVVATSNEEYDWRRVFNEL